LNGFINGALVGRNASEFVAVAANAPGPLELVPMPDYNNGEPWWVFAGLDGEPVMQLPKEPGNAYGEIYAKTSWYGLVQNEKILDPAGIVKEKLYRESADSTVLQNFHKTMKNVNTNQTMISNVYHGRTYAAYCNGELKARSHVGVETSGSDRDKPIIERGQKFENLLTWSKVIWKGAFPMGVTEEELRAATPLSDSESGNVRVYLESRKLVIEFEVQKVSTLLPAHVKFEPSAGESRYGLVAGDGTVPVRSAEAQARGLDPRVKGDTATGVQMVFVQGGYGHQDSYDHPWTRWALLYSIVQIAQDAREASC
jgi:hypothetical protein